MGGFGRHNPFPFQLGGGQTEIEETWQELRKALGEGGAGPVGGIEDAWRWIKSEMIACAARMAERAVLQAFPDRCTDHLPVWEENLLVPQVANDQLRREAVTAALTGNISAVIPNLTAALQEIDPTIGISVQDEDTSFNFIPGRYYRPRGVGYTAYGGVGSSFPNFSSWFVVQVLWPGGIPDAGQLAQAVDILNNVLPSWVDWQITNGPCYYDGFNDTYYDISGYAP